jgi:predicted RecA/RadA family phage recombinase
MATLAEQLAAGLKLGCPLEDCKSFRVVAPEAAYTAGQVTKIEDTVCAIYADTAAADYATAIYQAERITLAAATVPTAGWSAGDVCYYVSGTITGTYAGGRVPCGLFLEDAALGDTTVTISLDGRMSALWAAIAAAS